MVEPCCAICKLNNYFRGAPVQLNVTQEEIDNM